MTSSWIGYVRNRELLDRFYTSVPPLESVAVRSVNLSRVGPTVTLRFDLPGFANKPDEEWVEHHCDRFQCQVKFLAVDQLSMRSWSPPAVASVALRPRPLRRIHVHVTGEGIDLDFTSSDSLLVAWVSAYAYDRDATPGSETYYYASPLGRRRYGSILPEVTERNFYV
ncbi:Imm50 family immunity protein [Streptomyces sp. NPDC002055]|uniref:Imm50 family immunity protein n=1 Tax=Streptomyces sp. NPDC002055 TaxID=3154534 RepID=UPI003325DEEC